MISLGLFVFGLLIGSFINAAVWRIHRGITLLRDRSRCVHCQQVLSPRDLVPLLSYVVLQGKCRHCRLPISKQYPIVELLTGALFALSAAVWDVSTLNGQVHLGFWLASLTGLLILAIYDLRWMLLPDKVLLPLLALSIGQHAVLILLGQPLIVSFNALLAALLSGLFFFGLYAYSQGRWMGFGDVKLVVLMGLLLGLTKTLIALLLAFNAAALLSLILIALKRLSRKDLVPFGPFLIGSTIVAMLFGEPIFRAYLSWFGLL